MAFISNDEINNIRARANIVDIVQSYLPLTQRGRNYISVCPFLGYCYACRRKGFFY
jgi:DNA primase